MQIEYIGKKKALHLTFPWLITSILIAPKKPVEVDDADGLRLVADYPETFREYRQDPLEKFIAEIESEESFDVEITGDDTPPPAQEEAAVATDDIEFEVENGQYLCPFCEKTYAASEGGKRWLIKHLEKDHAAEWGKAVADAKREQEQF